jgi:hypothetical protein
MVFHTKKEAWNLKWYLLSIEVSKLYMGESKWLSRKMVGI